MLIICLANKYTSLFKQISYEMRKGGGEGFANILNICSKTAILRKMGGLRAGKHSDCLAGVVLGTEQFAGCPIVNKCGHKCPGQH